MHWPAFRHNDETSEQDTTASPATGKYDHTEKENKDIVADRPRRLNLETGVTQDADKVTLSHASCSDEIDIKLKRLEAKREQYDTNTKLFDTQKTNLENDAKLIDQLGQAVMQTIEESKNSAVFLTS